MKRLLTGPRLVIPILVVGCFAALMLVWAGATASASRSDSPIKIEVAMPPPHDSASNLVTSLFGATCSVAITQTADTIGGANGNNFNSAAVLASTTGLSLVGNVAVPPPATAVTVTTFDEYFALNNATVGAIYEVKAVPHGTSNYNLGIIVYNASQTPILTDTDPLAPAPPGGNPNIADVIITANNAGPYYFRVVQLLTSCTGGTYDLTVTQTNPPTISQPDDYDSAVNAPTYNETITAAAQLFDNSITDLTLYNLVAHPTDAGADQDWYTIYLLAGYQATVSAKPDGTYPPLFMEIVGPDKNVNNLIFQDPGSNNPHYTWFVAGTGNYYIHIRRVSSGSPTNGTYHIDWSTNSPTATLTPTPGTPSPTDTPIPGSDAFEPNYDFDHAAGIGLNVKYTGLNFVPTLGGTIDNDFFKVRVKRGMLVSCETLDLTPGTDTNMILYDDSRNGLAGNDDVNTLAGELRSKVTVSINYDGFLYILVGQGYAVPNVQSQQYGYSLQCTTPGSALATATNTPVPGAPTFTPRPSATPLPSPTVSATPVPMPPISVRALPTSTPVGPAQQMVTADLRVYYDLDENGVFDPGEGVVGLPARVYDATTGALLAQGFTDDTGHAVFTVPSAGAIRVVVPYLSFETIVQPSGAAIPVRISPRELPKQIP